MGANTSVPSGEIDSNIVWDEIQTTGDTPAADEGRFVFNNLAVSVGDNTYFFGNSYTVDKEGYGVTYSAPRIHVFNATSAKWRKVQTATEMPAKKFKSGFYGAAVGTDIWVLHNATWFCFDTVKEDWRSVAISTPCINAVANSVAVLEDKIYFYNGDHQAIQKNIICLDTKDQTVTELPDAFGEHPEEQNESYLFTIDHDTLGLYSKQSIYTNHGDIFYYDLKEHKWSRAKVSLTKFGKDSKDSISLPYIGRFNNVLYFVGPKSTGKRYIDTIWGREIGAKGWIRLKVGGKIFPKTGMSPNVAGNRDNVYLFNREGIVFQLKKLSVNIPTDNTLNEQLIAQARKELQEIVKLPAPTIDEFNNEPVILDDTLSSVKSDTDIHHRIVSDIETVNGKKKLEKTLPDASAKVIQHQNYLHYLTLAWSNHFSVVISPDILFYTVLCEIADQIKKNPEDYRTLFTDSTKKKTILTLTADPEQIDLDSVIKGIAKNTPVDAEIFTADFSSSTFESKLAMNAAFCDAMSPFYDYATTCCGIPRVKILGTKQDWQLFEQKIHRMRTEVFSLDLTTDKSLSTYLQGVVQQIRLIYTSRSVDFWRQMFSINRCGSGHTDQVKGWICVFYRHNYRRRNKAMVEYFGKDFYNYESHISEVTWQNIDTHRKFKLSTGLLYSNIVRGADPLDKSFPWLEPQFAHFTEELNE